MTQIDDLSIVISSSAREVIAELEKLATTLGKFSGATKKAGGAAENMGQKVSLMSAATQSAGEQSGETAKKVSDFSEKMKSITSRVDAFGKKIVSMSGNMRTLGSIAKAGGAALANAFTSPIKRIAEATRSMSRFLASIKRIVMVRGIRAAIRAITSGFSEGLKNLYAWSNALNGSFAASMDRLATSAQYLKNSFAAMASPLIEALAPAIDFVVDKFVDLFNIVNQIFAYLTGSTTYTAAKKVSAVWDDSTKKAGSAKKAADDLKRTILGFDEINKLVKPNSSSGSSGSGSGSSVNASNMFEKRSINSWLRDAIDSGNFTAIGNVIADKINKALGSIDWDDIKAKASHITDSITSLLNGFIEEIKPDILGKSLAEVINTATTFINGFWTKVQWATAGERLRNTIMNFFQTIDVEQLADAMLGQFRSIVTFVKNAIPSDPEEWKLIGGKIADFVTQAITDIPAADIGAAFSTLFNLGIRSIIELANSFTLTQLAGKLKDALTTAINGIDKNQLGEAIVGVLRDAAKALTVLLDINIGIGDVEIPLWAAGLGVLALKNAVSTMFVNAGLGKMGGLGSMLFGIGVTLAVEAVINAVEIVKGAIDGENVDWNDVVKIIKDLALASSALFAAKGNYSASIIAVGVGLTIEPTVTAITGIVEAIGERKPLDTGDIFSVITSLMELSGFIVGGRQFGAVAGAIKGGAGIGSVATKALPTFGFAISLMLLANKLDGIKNAIAEGEKISETQIADMVGSAFTTAGLGVLAFTPYYDAGVIMLGIGVSLQLIPLAADWAKKSAQKKLQDNGMSEQAAEALAGAVQKEVESSGGAYSYVLGSKGGGTVTQASLLDIIKRDLQNNKNKVDTVKGKISEALSEMFGRFGKGNEEDEFIKFLEENVVPQPGAGNGFHIERADVLPTTGVTPEQRLEYLNGEFNPYSSSFWKRNKTGNRKTNPTQYHPKLNTNSSASGGGTSLSWVFNPTLGKNGITIPINFKGKNTKVVDDVKKNPITAAVNFVKSTSGFLGGAFNSLFTSWYGRGDKGETTIEASVELKRDGWTTIEAFVGDKVNTGVWLQRGNYNSLQDFVGHWVQADLYLIPRLAATGAVAGMLFGIGRAKGGVYAGGKWSDIPQYAGGTTNAGSLFMAGENGPEVVGHVGGRTEVLNKSQMAAAMYSAVSSAMAPASTNFRAAASDMDARASRDADTAMLIEYVRAGSEATQRQNELLRQQNEYLRQINAKEFRTEITTASINDAQRRSNRRMGVEVVPVR